MKKPILSGLPHYKFDWQHGLDGQLDLVRHFKREGIIVASFSDIVSSVLFEDKTSIYLAKEYMQNHGISTSTRLVFPKDHSLQGQIINYYGYEDNKLIKPKIIDVVIPDSFLFAEFKQHKSDFRSEGFIIRRNYLETLFNADMRGIDRFFDLINVDPQVVVFQTLNMSQRQNKVLNYEGGIGIPISMGNDWLNSVVKVVGDQESIHMVGTAFALQNYK
ncbi:MAG: hypothetical protein ACP5N2_02225 [Candidatus Nanoarchaeia archaeon]